MADLIRGKWLSEVLNRNCGVDLVPVGVEFDDDTGVFTVDGEPIDDDSEYEIWNTANSRRTQSEFDGSADWSVRRS